MSLLSAHALTCRRGERFVFANLDLAAEAGDAVVLTGRNGSGKSSLLRVLAGLLPAYSGSLMWDGEPVDGDKEAHRARLAYVGHQDAVKPVLSVRENLMLFAGLSGEDVSDEAINVAMSALDISHLSDMPGRYLSSGQKRRTALARILLAPRDLWLLDEPTVGLDTASCQLLESIIEKHRAAGGMVIYSTHIPLTLENIRGLDLNAFAVPLDGWLDDDGDGAEEAA